MKHECSLHKEVGDYGCNQCIYQTTQKGNMIRHVCSIHNNYMMKQNFSIHMFICMEHF